MFSVKWQNGILVTSESASIILDPLKKTPNYDFAFVSHAHMDHTVAFTDPVKIKYSTRETTALYEAVSDRKPRNVVPCLYGKSIPVHDFQLKAVNSGHVFGSAALLLDGDGVTFFYTGDFNFTDSLTQRAISPCDCDVLAIETTYGRPDFVFPNREEVYDSIVQWAATTIMEGHVPCFFVYPVGKAQEITRLFNLYTSIPVVTHPSITKTNRTVNSFGGDLVFYDMAKEGEELLRSKNCVCLFPTSLNLKTVKLVHPDAKVAMVTGWGLRFGKRAADATFVLSSHADYAQLLRFVEECGPKKVYTVHGYAGLFANKLKRMGFDAEPLEH
ncbi:MAG: MBL fold metallo-hydrolase [Candidatus Verstraetearchaeota archaeon]|nr:MBL fold metallo-hydrolase [Candidatus Verstraetearchaeota archaeon]